MKNKLLLWCILLNFNLVSGMDGEKYQIKDFYRAKIEEQSSSLFQSITSTPLELQSLIFKFKAKKTVCDFKPGKKFESISNVNKAGLLSNELFALSLDGKTAAIIDKENNCVLVSRHESSKNLFYEASCLALFSNSTMLAIGSADDNVYVVSTDSGEILQTLHIGDKPSSMVLSPNNCLLVVGCEDKKTCVFETNKWQMILKNKDHYARVLGFLSDENLLLAQSSDGALCILNPKTLTCLQEVRPDELVTAEAFVIPKRQGFAIGWSAKNMLQVFEQYTLPQSWGQHFLWCRICLRINCAKFKKDINSVEDMFNEGFGIISSEDLDAWQGFPQEDQRYLWSKWSSAIRTYKK